jgi:hypothetical protein
MQPSPPDLSKWDDKTNSESTWPYVTVALVTGVLVLIASHFIFPKDSLRQTLSDLVRDFGMVLVSVWGVSLFYEHFLAERHFDKFHVNLRTLIRQGEMNAAMCEGMGILEIFRSRRDFEGKHSLANETLSLVPGDVIRLTGRSLIFSMFGWRHLKTIVENGATVQLCLFDPAIRESPLDYLAGYLPQETDLVLLRIVTKVKPWLASVRPKGNVEVRLHRVHLLDSLMEINCKGRHRLAWDLNFGEGTEERYIFYLNGDGPLGRNLTDGRYRLIWSNSSVILRYRDGNLEVDKLADMSPPSPEAGIGATASQTK